MNRIKPIKLVSIVILCSLINGCAAVFVAGAAGLVYDRRSVTTMEADARLFHVIHTEIAKDPQFDDSRISVTSFNRVVLLVGQANAASLKVKAEKIAQNAPGVKRVYNQITIGDPISISRQTKDTWITGQVRSQMLTKKGLDSGSIRVVTEDGVVYLLGIVSKEQSELAVDVARRIPGVVRVVKMFQYIQ